LSSSMMKRFSVTQVDHHTRGCHPTIVFNTKEKKERKKKPHDDDKPMVKNFLDLIRTDRMGKVE